MRKETRSNLITFGGASVLFIVMAILSSAKVLSSSMSGILPTVGIYVIYAISLNLTVGVLGELSLGHAGFMCVGAFTSGAVSLIFRDTIQTEWLRFALALIAGGVMAAIFGILIGIPVLRLRGDYLAIVTLGFGEIVRSIAGNIFLVSDKNGLHFGFINAPKDIDAATKTDILRGPRGMSPPRDTNIWIVVAVLLITLIILMNFIDSKSGRACKAVRDNYIAAQAVGINVTKYKLMAFTLSAAIAGVAGGLYAHSFSNISATKFDYNLSILILVFVVLGGLGSLRGSIIATIILYALPELFLRDLGNFRMLIYAIILILVMLFNNAPFFINIRKRVAASAPVQKIMGIFKKKDKTTGGAA